MKPVVPPSYYFDPQVFETEKRRVFARTWNFIGVKSEVASDQDFITTDIAGKSVVVQNFDGELKAFHNVCSHRFSKIQNEACGNRRFQCPYHGWIYDKNGVPYAIPKRPKFPELTEELACAMGLTRYDLDSCGQLLFVRESSSGPGLREYFGDLYADLEAMSYGIGKRIDRNEFSINANWKICVENTLESYHVGFVHVNTFKKLGINNSEFTFVKPHSVWEGLVDEQLARRFERVQMVYGKRSYKIPGYKHVLLFPSVTVATTYGSSFAIQEFKPVAPNRTAFVSHVFDCNLGELEFSALSMVDAMNESIVDFNRRVFEEDRAVIEYVQLGSEQTDRTGILSDEEERVCAFQNAYTELMEAS